MTKNSIFSCITLSIIGLALAGLSFNYPIETLRVNTEKSEVTWKGYKVTGEHSGTIAVSNGELMFEDGKLTGGAFKIDMTSIKCTDLQGEWAGKLEGHLKSPDFFGVEKYPTANFEITKVASRGMENEYKITGNMTIKETTKEIRFNASVSKEKATADLQLDRTDFQVQYGSGSFFDNLGDKTIYDEFDLSISFVLE